jgi:Glucodextranase, domain B/zinc-ribbon domain
MSETLARYCGNCGNELDPEDRFCQNCGRPVHQTAQVPTPDADVPVPPPPQQEAGTQPLEQADAQPREPWTTRQYALGCLGVFFVVFVVGAFVAALAGNGGGGNEAQKNKKGGGGKDTASKPELVVSSPSGSPTLTSDSIEVKGEVTPATSKVTVNGEEVTPADDGSFSTPFHLNVGENYIQITAERGSEQADASRTVTREPAEKEIAAQEAPQVQKNDSSGQTPPANVPPPTVEEQLFAKIAGVFLLKEKSVDSMAKYVRGQEFKPSQADGLKRVYIVRDARGCGYINVEFYEQDASYMEIDMEQVYERVYKNRELSRNVCNVQVSAFQKLQDDYGQTFMTKTYATSMNKATANKVRDWLMVEQPNIWTVHKMHPVVKEELAQNAVEHAADCAEDEGLFDMQPLDCP